MSRWAKEVVGTAVDGDCFRDLPEDVKVSLICSLCCPSCRLGDEEAESLVPVIEAPMTDTKPVQPDEIANHSTRPLSIRQRRIVWLGMLCLSALALWVPWKYPGNARTSGVAGYGFIFYPPQREHVVIDATRLLLPMGMVAGLATVAVVFSGSKVRRNDSK